MADSQKRSAAFVRGFFGFLEEQQIRAAVLHGGVDGFERELSDVDFTVERRMFSRLPELIDAYCAKSGWQLCQVLRHETTAAYHVCSAIDDPSCAVALDVCSDYQRNGTIFLSAEELLENRRALAWGGYGLASANELRYRFAKAAAKNKDPATCAGEFSTYPDDARRKCETWLVTQWGITLGSWEVSEIDSAFMQLRGQSKRRPTLFQHGALKRILSRILRPTGMIVVTGAIDFDTKAASLEFTFRHLYFRHCRKTRRWQPMLLKDIISSTLIVIPELSVLWQKLLPADCIHKLDTDQDAEACQRTLAQHLHQRCNHRQR